MNRSTREKWGLAASIVLGLVFVLGAVGKLVDLGGFAAIIRQQGVAANAQQAALFARLVVAGELLVGLGLCQGAWRRRLFVPLGGATILLMSLWLLGLILRGYHGDCGCFGALAALSPSASLAKNVPLFGLAVLAWCWVPSDPVQGRAAWLRVLGATVAAAAMLTVWPLSSAALEPGPEAADPGARATTDTAPAHPASAFARFREFRAPDDAGPRRVDLTAQPCVVAFLSLDCEHCQAAARVLAQGPDTLPVYAVYLGQPEAVPDFVAATGLDAPWLLADPLTFFDFVPGTPPPRTVLLVAGDVHTEWFADTELTAERLQQAWRSVREPESPAPPPVTP